MDGNVRYELWTDQLKSRGPLGLVLAEEGRSGNPSAQQPCRSAVEPRPRGDLQGQGPCTG
jgi:hypothetical protein